MLPLNICFWIVDRGQKCNGVDLFKSASCELLVDTTTVVVGVVVVCLIAKNVWEQDPAVCDGGFAH